MALASVLPFVLVASLKNRVRRHLKRIRQPRYAIATAVGLFYVWQLVARRWGVLTHSGPLPPMADTVRPYAELGLMALGAWQVLGVWLWSDERAQLAFTEAEVQFLFPAPIARLGLVHYKLARGFLWLAFGALVSAAFIGRLASANAWLFTLGAWVGLSALYLHRIAASFTRERLLRGRRVRRWALAAALLAGGAKLVSLSWEHARDSAGAADLSGALAQVQAALSAPPVSYVLWPLRALVHLALAETPRAFLAALPAALAVLALQYVWLLATVTPFEEASAAAAEVRGRMIETRQRGAALTVRWRRPLWRLGAQGRPEIALAWKNALALTRRTPVRGAVWLALVLFVGPVIALRSAAGAALGPLCVAAAAVLLLFGPVRLTLDLRHDLPRLDLLRAMPLSGEQVIWGELLVPWLALTALQWICWAGAVLSPDLLGSAGRLQQGGAFFTAALLSSGFTLLGLVMQNGAALLFPDWMAAMTERRRGFDAVGQRLLTLVGTVMVLGLGAVPAGIAFGLVVAALWHWFGWSGHPIGAVAAAAVLSAEAWLGIGWVGRLFDAHDVSS